MTHVLGRDLLATYRVTDGRHEDVDVATELRTVRGRPVIDACACAGVDNAVQAVVHRIKTVQGELADLGHPEYGSRHHSLVGQPNTERNRNLVKLYILQALALEPRIEQVLAADVVDDPQRDRVSIALTLRFTAVATPQDLVRAVQPRGAIVSYVAEPYLHVADQVLTALTGGVARESHRFFAGANAFSFAIGGDRVEPDSVRVIGQVSGEFFAFRPGRDFAVERDGMLRFRANPDNPREPDAGATWPDEGTELHVGYYPVDAGDAMLTDRNVGSLTRTMGEAFARELTVLRKQLELIHRSAFLETAEGTALDMVVALLGVTRKARDHAQGSVRFFRDVPAPADIFIPAGTRVSTALAAPGAGGAPPSPVSFATTSDRTLARGQLSIEAVARAQERGPRGVVEAQAIGIVDQPVLGISGVVNDAATVFGAAGESDAELRRRARTVAERAGRATPRALANAIAGIGKIRENDVKIVEELTLRPGVVQVFVAAPPELTGAVEEAIHSTRAAGIRVEHNIQSLAPGATSTPAAAGTLREDGVLELADGPESAPFLFAVVADVTVFCEDPRVSGSKRLAIEQGVSAAITAYIEASEIGDTLVYNRISAAVMSVPGVYDAVLDIAAAPPQETSSAGEPVAGKRNIAIPVGRRAVIAPNAIKVTFAGTPLSFDLSVVVRPRGDATAAGIRRDIRERLAPLFAAPIASVQATVIAAALPVTATYQAVSPNDVSWTAEHEQAGLIIREAGGHGAATDVPDASRAVLRDVAVTLRGPGSP